MRGNIMINALAASLLSAASARGDDIVLRHQGPDPIADFVPRYSGKSPIHRRGKFKQNARRQKGRKTLPRASK